MQLQAKSLRVSFKELEDLQETLTRVESFQVGLLDKPPSSGISSLQYVQGLKREVFTGQINSWCTQLVHHVGFDALDIKQTNLFLLCLQRQFVA